MSAEILDNQTTLNHTGLQLEHSTNLLCDLSRPTNRRSITQLRYSTSAQVDMGSNSSKIRNAEKKQKSAKVDKGPGLLTARAREAGKQRRNSRSSQTTLKPLWWEEPVTYRPQTVRHIIGEWKCKKCTKTNHELGVLEICVHCGALRYLQSEGVEAISTLHLS